MKPLVHYIRARISGKEIPETRRPSRSATIPLSRWHLRLWTPRTHRATAGADDPRVWPSRAKSRPLIDEDEPSRQPVRIGARLPPVKDGAPVSESLELPIHRRSEEGSLDDLDAIYQSTRSDQKYIGNTTERWDRQENVWNYIRGWLTSWCWRRDFLFGISFSKVLGQCILYSHCIPEAAVLKPRWPSSNRDNLSHPALM